MQTVFAIYYLLWSTYTARTPDRIRHWHDTIECNMCQSCVWVG